jgi:hypothetical protein
MLSWLEATLRKDPMKRPRALELQLHDWFKNLDSIAAIEALKAHFATYVGGENHCACVGRVGDGASRANPTLGPRGQA